MTTGKINTCILSDSDELAKSFLKESMDSGHIDLYNYNKLIHLESILHFKIPKYFHEYYVKCFEEYDYDGFYKLVRVAYGSDSFSYIIKGILDKPLLNYSKDNYPKRNKMFYWAIKKLLNEEGKYHDGHHLHKVIISYLLKTFDEKLLYRDETQKYVFDIINHEYSCSLQPISNILVVIQHKSSLVESWDLPRFKKDMPLFVNFFDKFTPSTCHKIVKHNRYLIFRRDFFMSDSHDIKLSLQILFASKISKKLRYSKHYFAYYDELSLLVDVGELYELFGIKPFDKQAVQDMKNLMRNNKKKNFRYLIENNKDAGILLNKKNEINTF